MRGHNYGFSFNHFFKPLAGVVFGAVFGLGLGSVAAIMAAPARQAVPAVLQTQKLQIVDKDGVTRIDMGVEADNSSRITMRDWYGKEGMILEVSRAGETGVKLRDRDSKQRVQLAVTQNKSAVLTLADQDEKPCAVLASEPDGSQTLTLLHTKAEKKSGIVLLLTPDGKTQVLIYENGKPHSIKP
jgi:hypothetical protein